jgi:hypothetical protein
MTRKIWVLAIASVLVSVILLDEQIFATDVDGRKKIAVFLDGTPWDVQRQAVALSKSVMGGYDDLAVSILSITPALPPLQQTYDWGFEHIRVDDAHEKLLTVTGVGVQVAILGTGVGPHADLPTGDNQIRGTTNCVFSWETRVRA